MENSPIKKFVALASAALAACMPARKAQAPEDCVEENRSSDVSDYGKLRGSQYSTPAAPKEECVEEPKPHIAPPPAYGNKVVKSETTPENLTVAGQKKGGRYL